MFVELQIELQKSFKLRTIIFGYANGYIGYVPDAKSFETDSYETNPSWVHRVGQYAGANIIEAGKTLLKTIAVDI